MMGKDVQRRPYFKLVSMCVIQHQSQGLNQKCIFHRPASVNTLKSDISFDCMMFFSSGSS